MINIPLRLKELRERYCLTQEEVAAVMKVSRSSYTYYESGRVKPSLSGLELLREFYGLSWDQLMQEEEEKPTVRCGMGIRRYRRRRGLSVDELAARCRKLSLDCHLHGCDITRLEEGKRFVSNRELNWLSQILDTSIVSFFA